MKVFQIFCLVLVSFTANAQIVNIPDANFKSALLNHDPVIDTNNDGEIQQSEAEAVIIMSVDHKEISSMEGIQSFTNLVHLVCHRNELTSLDVTQNSVLEFLWCFDNNLTSLDVSQNSNLETLVAYNNNLSSIDVSQNAELKVLGVERNNISTLDVSENLQLISLHCGYNNLSVLDVDQNIMLGSLHCTGNMISELNVTSNTLLTSLGAGSNGLSTIDLTQNPDLEVLNLWYNNLTEIDISQNPNIALFYCQGNQLSSLDVTQQSNLNLFYCQENQITSLDLSQNLELQIFECHENNLMDLDVSQSLELVHLKAHSNLLNSFNIKNGNNVNLAQMSAYNNPNLGCIQVDDVVFANSQECDLTNFNGWCKDTAATYAEKCLLGTPDLDLLSITLFPNPVNNILNVTSQRPIDTIMIYSLQGILVMVESKPVIDVSELPSGLYFVSVTIEGKRDIKRFLKY
jgi:hypothetical protein